MPSAKKTGRSRKAAVSAKSRGASAKKARKASVAVKTASAKAPSKAAQARRKSATRAKSGSAKSAAKSVTAKASASRATRKTVKSAAKSAARPASKTSAAGKTRVAAKRPAAKRSVAKNSASTRARTAVAAAKTIARKTVASKPHASKTAPKKAAGVAASSPAPTKLAAKPVAPAENKIVSVKAVKELKTPVVKPANQILEPLAPRHVAAPAAVPQSVSEPKEVRQNLSQQPAAKPVAEIAANAQVLARTTAHLRPAPVVQKPSAAGGKARPVSQKLGFKLSEFIVYPAHGVGQIVGIETQEVAGFSLELFVVSFVKDKMILKVPTSKAPAVGMRKLSESAVVEKALATLTGRARIKRTMWSRRAQEYEAKINSGDLVTIAEVVRDLYRSDTQPEQSYSERQLYEAALDRMAREVAAVRKLIDQEALSLIESFLAKAPRRGPKNEIEGEEDVDRAA